MKFRYRAFRHEIQDEFRQGPTLSLFPLENSFLRHPFQFTIRDGF
jgi:hypothetical protein